MSFKNDPSAEARRHELLADIAEHIAHRLVEEHGMTEDAACDVGNSLADFVAAHWGGHDFYLPRDQAFKLNSRDWDIFRRFERGNAVDLAREFNISTVRVYQIYKRCLVEYRSRVQGGLFQEEEPQQ